MQHYKHTVAEHAVCNQNMQYAAPLKPHSRPWAGRQVPKERHPLGLLVQAGDREPGVAAAVEGGGGGGGGRGAAQGGKSGGMEDQGGLHADQVQWLDGWQPNCVASRYSMIFGPGKLVRAFALTLAVYTNVRCRKHRLQVQWGRPLLTAPSIMGADVGACIQCLVYHVNCCWYLGAHRHPFPVMSTAKPQPLGSPSCSPFSSMTSKPSWQARMRSWRGCRGRRTACSR